MIKALVSDFSKVVLLPVNDQYTGGLNALYRELKAQEQFDFWKYFRLNRDLLEWYKTISGRVAIYLFTAEYIQEDPVVHHELGVFKRIFSGALLGLKKNETQTYTTIADIIGLQPEQILYVDDKQENCDAAQKAGMIAVRYESNEQTMRDFGKAMHNG
ncbi:HAD-IA family hydrolase [Candidatus Uhrbacteria bacterium]|nr:HAD-IA family hydrolase [Candidatus Uhrbacteria bacterium]